MHCPRFYGTGHEPNCNTTIPSTAVDDWQKPTKIAFTLTHLSAVVTAATRQKMDCNQGQALAALRSVLKYAYKKKVHKLKQFNVDPLYCSIMAFYEVLLSHLMTWCTAKCIVKTPVSYDTRFPHRKLC